MHRNSWLIGIVALTAGLASAQDGPKGTGNSREPAIASAAAVPRLKFTNRLSSTAVFIKNQGQFDPRVKFEAKIGGQTAWLTADGIVFDVTRRAADDAARGTVSSVPASGSGAKLLEMRLPFASGRPEAAPHIIDKLVFAEDLVRANCCSKVEGRDPQPGIYNYFQGRDSSQWHTNVKGFAEVVYRDVWPGIDLRVYGNGSNLEQEFIVQLGGDLSLVQVAYRGVDKLSIGGDGSLAIATAFGTLRETHPQIFQQIDGKRETVEGRYRLTSQTSYTFDVQAHNVLSALVIDPTLLYSTFLGGNAGYSSQIPGDQPAGIAVDSSGNAYVAGNTYSTNFPTTVSLIVRPGPLRSSDLAHPGS